jgi:hypothetical protein
MTVVDPPAPHAPGAAAGWSPSVRTDGAGAGFRTGTDLASATDEELCDELRFAAFWCGAAGDGGGIGRVGPEQVRAVLEAAVHHLSTPVAGRRPGGDEGPHEAGAADALVRRARAHGAEVVSTAHGDAARLHHDAAHAVRPVFDALQQLQAAQHALRLAAEQLAPRR